MARGKTASIANGPDQNALKNARASRLVPDVYQVSDPAKPPPFIYDAFAIIHADTGETRTFDGATSEDLSRSAEVTRHPVETGAKVSDHVVPNPAVFGVSLVVSENMHEGTGGRGWTNVSGPARVREVHEWLDDTLRNGVLLKIQTSFGLTLYDYVIESYATNRDNKGQLVFQVMFAKIEFAQAVTAQLDPVPRRGGAKKKTGTTPGNPGANGVGLDPNANTRLISGLQTIQNNQVGLWDPGEGFVQQATRFLTVTLSPQ